MGKILDLIPTGDKDPHTVARHQAYPSVGSPASQAMIEAACERTGLDPKALTLPEGSRLGQVVHGMIERGEVF